MINNYLSPLEFVLTVKRLPNVQFFTQRVAIPNISLQQIDRPTPFKSVFETGDRLTYSELNMSFIVDENMNNYIEVFNWMKGISFPETFDQFRNLNQSDEGLRSDISLLIMNSHKNPNIEITYIDCFPIGLSEVSLDTTQSDLVYPEATVTFVYNSYDIKQLTNN